MVILFKRWCVILCVCLIIVIFVEIIIKYVWKKVKIFVSWKVIDKLKYRLDWRMIFK